MKPLRVIIAAYMVVITVAFVWTKAASVWTSIQISFANEQTMIFAQMVDQASEASQQMPPNVPAIISCLDYTHSYYPPGTKQTVGLPLNQVVERTRFMAERQIIGMLRQATNKDFGDDASDWIIEYTQTQPSVSN
ncbi:hypothetical protein [Planctopirus hydrillae]|nr:hypothetical protein [Planctopirus hydrillae]